MQWFALATPFIFQWRKCFHVTKHPNSHSGNVRTCYQHVGHAEHDGWREFQLIWIRFHEVDTCTHSSTFFYAIQDMSNSTTKSREMTNPAWFDFPYLVFDLARHWDLMGLRLRSTLTLLLTFTHTHNHSLNNSHQTCSQTYHHAFFTQFMQDAHSFNDFWLERHVLSPPHALRTPHAIISEFYFNTQQKHQ